MTNDLGEKVCRKLAQNPYKTLMRILLILILILSAFSSISAQKNRKKTEENLLFDPHTAILVRFDEQSAQYRIAVNEALLKESILTADAKLVDVEKIFVQALSPENVYLIFHCIDKDENSRKKALLLRQLSKGVFKATQESQKETVCLVCEGNCCNNCEFRIFDNKFHGCECKKECDKADEYTPGICINVIGQKVTMMLSPIKKIN